MTSALDDREQRRARHAQRVSALREQRDREPRESITRSVDPFRLADADPYLEVFSA